MRRWPYARRSRPRSRKSTRRTARRTRSSTGGGSLPIFGLICQRSSRSTRAAPTSSPSSLLR
eukprot:3943599-Pyramimonas_sp.AAC.1